MTWAVFVNPRAGSRRQLERRTRDALEERHIPFRLETPLGRQEMESAILQAADEGFQRFVIVGGDGTLHVAVNALMDREWDQKPILGFLPAGTGSDFARTFALPQTIEGAADYLVGDRIYPIDIGIVEGPFGRRAFVNEVQAGVGAATAAVAERAPRFIGAAKYQVAFWIALARFRRAEVALQAGDKRFEGMALAVIAANGQFFGGGLNVAPKATLVDGKLDIQTFAVNRSHAPVLFPKIKRGLHLGFGGVHRYASAEFTLEADRPWPVEADGEYLGTTPIQGHIVPAAISFKS